MRWRALRLRTMIKLETVKEYEKLKMQEEIKRSIYTPDPSYEKWEYPLFGRDYYELESLRSAYERIKSKDGNFTHGFRRQTLDGIDWTWFLKTSEQLKSGIWSPVPVMEVEIPKGMKGIFKVELSDYKNPGRRLKLFPADPKGKKRPLGIPDPKDKIVQEALRADIERKIEPKLDTYAYRRNIGPTQAVRKIQSWKGLTWMIEGDIKGYFDNVDHEILVRDLEECGIEENKIKVIRKILKAGKISGNRYIETRKGTPQGGVISPLLANLYLHKFDEYVKGELKERNKHLKIEYVRFADDWIIGTNGTLKETKVIKEMCEKFLWENRKLELSKEKTLITNTKRRATFLGFEITRARYKKKLGKRKKDKLRVIAEMNTINQKLTVRGMVYMKEDYSELSLIKKTIKNYIRSAREELSYVRIADNKKDMESTCWSLKNLVFSHVAVHRWRLRGKQVTVKRIRSLYAEMYEMGLDNEIKKLIALIHKGDKKPLKYDFSYIKCALRNECEMCGSEMNVRVRSILRKQHTEGLPNAVSKWFKEKNRKHASICKSCEERE